jgi:putative acetyltransferase
MYVDPNFAGEGVGSSLLETLETTARENDLESLGLLASVNARGFYEHHGYEFVAETTFQFGEDVEGPAVEMRKELGGGNRT